MLSSATRTLVLIPARGGSKRLPGKNLRVLGGKPLIGWTIEAALQAAVAAEVVVSTESQEIAQAAAVFGAKVPFLRPIEFATDEASSVDVALHALNALGGVEKFSNLLLLQPTSPLRTSEDIVRAMELFQSSGADALVSTTPPLPSDYYLSVNSLGLSQPLGLKDRVVKLNGAIYAIKTEVLSATRSFEPDRTIVFPMPISRSVDIDIEEEWQLAERLLESEL